MISDREMSFYPKAKAVFVVGVLLTLSNVLFWQPDRHFLVNTVMVGSGMLTEFVVFYAFYKRINIAKYAVYFLTLLVTLSFALYPLIAPLQKAALIANVVMFYGTILVLFFFRDESKAYFRTTGSPVVLKVFYIIIFVLTTIATVSGVIFQESLKAKSKMAANELESTLIMEGTPNIDAVNACIEKYSSAGTDLSEEALGRFCKCVALNVDQMVRKVDPSGAENNFQSLLTKYMAIGDACMDRINAQ